MGKPILEMISATLDCAHMTSRPAATMTMRASVGGIRDLSIEVSDKVRMRCGSVAALVQPYTP